MGEWRWINIGDVMVGVCVTRVFVEAKAAFTYVVEVRRPGHEPLRILRPLTLPPLASEACANAAGWDEVDRMHANGLLPWTKHPRTQSKVSNHSTTSITCGPG
jgi:hypothetical protein